MNVCSFDTSAADHDYTCGLLMKRGEKGLVFEGTVEAAGFGNQIIHNSNWDSGI